MRGAAWCVAGRTRSRRAQAGIAVAESQGHGDVAVVPSPSPPARGRGRRGRGGSRGVAHNPPVHGHCDLVRGEGVIVLDDDDVTEGGENLCGVSGATLHVEAPSKCDRVRGSCSKEACTTWNLRLSHRGSETTASSFAVRSPGCSSSSVSSGLGTVEKPYGSVPACGKDSVRSNGVVVVSVLADEANSETTGSVHGGGKGNADLGQCISATGCSPEEPKPENVSSELNVVSSNRSISASGDTVGTEVESGGRFATGAVTEQAGSQSFNANSDPSPPKRDHRAGEETTAKAGAIPNEESGAKPENRRGASGTSYGADSHGATSRTQNQLDSIARRTRSKLFGDKYRPVVYTSFFKDSESSDGVGEEADDSDTEETPASSVSSLSSTSSSPFESEESAHSDDSWMKNTEERTINRRRSEGGYCSDAEPAPRRRKSSCDVDAFFTSGESPVDNSVRVHGNKTVWENHIYFSKKDMKNKQHGPSGKTVNHVHRADGEKFAPSPAHTGNDERNSGEKPAKARVLDVDECSEGDKMTRCNRKRRCRRREFGFNKTTKRKRFRGPRNESLFKVFIDKIWGKTEASADEALPLMDAVLSLGQTTIKDNESLPFIFSFGDEDQKPAEKSEYEKALDELWAEFDFALNSNDIGSYKVDESVNDDMDVDDVESHRCINNGAHHFVLDEQIGIKCKLCSFVSLEIRYLLPILATERSEGILGRPYLEKSDGLPQLEKLFVSENKGSSGNMFEHCKGTVWDLIPGVRPTLYPHQREAFEFMWRNLAGDTFLGNQKGHACYDGPGGCVISHAPGTGKSRLTIVFLQAFLGVFPECRPVIVAPRGMLLTWKREFEKWKIDIPVHDLNDRQLSGKEDKFALRMVLGEQRKEYWTRIVKLFSWNKGHSILALSYCLFEKLVGSLNKQEMKNPLGKILLDKPGLFVFDEGHTPRNERSCIWKAVRKIRTERRIILSGTPFQNNFSELYNTFCLVRPKFADKISCKAPQNCQRKEFVIENEEDTLPSRDEGRGKWASLTSSIDDERLKELRLMMKPFVHVHNGSSLRCLPGLKDCLIVLDPLPRQKSVLEIVEDVRSDTTFAMDYKNCLVSVHPSLLSACTLSEKEASKIDISQLKTIRLNPNEGVKTKFVMELVRLCQPLHEKVLVFSQYIEPLDLFIKQLELTFGWKEGMDILKMDGKIRPRDRQSLIDAFNDTKSKAKVLLASIKACSEGISLTGASRVVLLDVVWNPSVERQAISRAYRLGQEKVVYIYHLITYGTREGDKYYKQVEKDRLSKLVFSAVGHGSVPDVSSDVSEDIILKEMVGHDKLKDMFKRILYQPKESNLSDAFMF